MIKSIYPFVRDLHLYLGLFLSPFVVLFSVSVFLLVHSWVPGGTAGTTQSETDLSLSPGFEQLRGREQVEAARAILAQVGINGEIWNIRQFPRQGRHEITVHLPGRETVVDLRVAERTATITRQETEMGEAFNYLHKLPGPHLVAIRGNSVFMQVWRWLTDAFVYLLLFITASGVYLWTVLRAERRTGAAFLSLGALSMGGLIYALIA
jgi:hypothetical protein